MMPLADIFFLAIVLYLLYRFVFNFLVPVARATRQVREQFRNMQDPTNNNGAQSQRSYTTSAQQNTTSAQRPGANAPNTGQRPSGKAPAGDYIDFEEIK
jgi:Domain of unknown function (DUF4834)